MQIQEPKRKTPEPAGLLLVVGLVALVLAVALLGPSGLWYGAGALALYFIARAPK